MYQKVRRRLTALFTLVTVILTAALVLLSFIMSARQQADRQFASYAGQCTSLKTELETTDVLTAEWLSSREFAGSLSLFLLDNGSPVFHNNTHGSRVTALYEEVASHSVAGNDGSLSFEDLPSLHSAAGYENTYVLCHGLFPAAYFFTDSVIKNGSLLQIFVIQPLDSLYLDLLHAAPAYLFLFAVSGIFLWLFSRYFTNRMLKPLLENEESQHRFISAVSHELRTPLAVILSSASACEKAPYEKQKTFFQVIKREGADMKEMLEQLLLLSRADNHALALQMESADMQTLLLESYEAFLPLYGSHHKLKIELPDTEIPPCPCDTLRIRQIINILLQNALSYTPEGSIICLGISVQSDKLQIHVSDNGPGIPDNEKEDIFTRFYRGKNISSEKGHHGLGLAVAREIALAHGGFLTADAAPEGGALFTLSLKLSDS